MSCITRTCYIEEILFKGLERTTGGNGVGSLLSCFSCFLKTDYMTAKEQAVQDIKDELRLSSRSFLAFRKKLDPIMDKLVEDYTKQQENGKG